MNLNYEKYYAYAELDCILKWLGDEYINKIPKKIMQKIKAEKKFAYRPELDFSKPLTDQVRQETKNIIAYLNINYWLEDEEKKKRIKQCIQENARKEKEKRKLEREKEIARRAMGANSNYTMQNLNSALQERLKK